MDKNNSPVNLLRDSKALFEAERRGLTMDDAMAIKYKDQITSIVKRYSEPFKDGFQMHDMKALYSITLDLVAMAEELKGLTGEEKKSLVMGAAMLAYSQHGKNLPWYLRWVPDSWIRKMIGSAVDAAVDFLKRKGVF
jgi:hypothetical protein